MIEPCQDLMLYIDQLHKVFYCPLKDNRQVDDSAGQQPYQRVDGLHWTAEELAHGKVIKVKGFPKLDFSQSCGIRYRIQELLCIGLRN